MESIHAPRKGFMPAKHNERKYFYYTNPKCGQPRKVDEAKIQEFVDPAENKDDFDVSDLCRQLGTDCSDRTACRYLNEKGLFAHVRPYKPSLDEKSAERRLDWANMHRAYTMRYWNRILFSDELRFFQIGSDKRKMYYCRRGQARKEGLKSRNSRKRVQGGGGSVFVWGVITSKGIGRIWRVKSTMNSQMYTEKLSDSLLGTLSDYNIDRSRVIFQQDNDPKHKAHLTQGWLEEHNIHVLPRQARSPDMNIIEHI